ncbi:membrane transporter [Trichoderma gamsii]|uniref:Membrane transporter n=1 Tax=Trichoderma gamsii TaxID=398673 RepID=A0A2P4ZGL0_9HYPO|nr:membrane transporter [Trichoderma gamsii]PON23413.1 membrane transporter [Trichoderma gamsii]
MSTTQSTIVLPPEAHGEDFWSSHSLSGATPLESLPSPGDQSLSEQQLFPCTPIRPLDTASVQEPAPTAVLELSELRIRQVDNATANGSSPTAGAGLFEEGGSPTHPVSQGVPPELRNFLAEIIFVLVCTAGQVILSLTLGQVVVNQFVFREALGIVPAQTPWLVGSSALASGLSVIVFGPLADLAPPKPLMVGAFLWEAVWNAVAASAISPELKILFFVARAMQGLAVGVLVSTSMSILGRVYNPGIRKTRVFSLMAAGAPFGFWIGCVQGGLLTAHLDWIFRSTAIFLAVCALAAYYTIPNLRPAADSNAADAPSIRQFDYMGALLASLGSGLILFGLTQGSAAQWNPYTYSLVIVGFLFLVAFHFVERRVARPLIPNGIWKTPGFVAVLVSYVFGFGAYSILAAWIVSKTLHKVPGHWIFATSMVCFGLGPVFFLPQTPNTSYWALSMPGVALATFGPDLSFAAASIFITSSVPRSYQGAAGSLLVTAQNLTMAIITSVADSIGIKVDQLPSGEVGLEGMRAIWWFGFASAMVGALITITMVRIPKAEEKEHVQ